MSTAVATDSLVLRLRALKLPSFVSHHAELASRAEREGWSFGQFLKELVELELNERKARRIERLRKKSDLGDPPLNVGVSRLAGVGRHRLGLVQREKELQRNYGNHQQNNQATSDPNDYS